jgi:hypothetical protein
MSFQCIGQKRVRRHSADKGELVRCTNTSETPTNAAKPEWGWLCAECSSMPAIGARPLEEAFNYSAAQCDIEEFRDQIDSGFMHGAMQSYESEEN